MYAAVGGGKYESFPARCSRDGGKLSLYTKYTIACHVSFEFTVAIHDHNYGLCRRAEGVVSGEALIVGIDDAPLRIITAEFMVFDVP